MGHLQTAISVEQMLVQAISAGDVKPASFGVCRVSAYEQHV